MPNTIFIYAKSLPHAQIEQFSLLADAKCIGQAVYLDYQITFFESESAACDLKEKARELKLDLADLTEIPDFSQQGLLLMDMDSTVIKIECIDEIAKLANVWVRLKILQKAFCKKCEKIYRLWRALKR